MLDLQPAVNHARLPGRGPAALAMVLLLVVVLAGCSSRPSPHGHMRTGDFIAARDMVESQVVNDRSDRRYMLDRMRAGVLNLDAGDPARAERWFAEVYDVLRTQGLNEDKTVSSIVVNEGVKVWKGEPFEQAMALVYYGFVQAQQGSWDNARAAADNALFYLRDFDQEESDAGRRINTEELALRAAEYEAQQNGGGDFESGDDYLDNGYIVERNNFTMAYLLHGIASQQLGRNAEASDFFNQVLALSPELGPLVAQLRAGDYNTIVVIADGLGPEKVATGPGGALSRFRPIDRSRSVAGLFMNGSQVAQLPMVTNLNTMALDHRWNNLEDVRVAKNFIGDLLITGGGLVALHAMGDDNYATAAIAAGVAGLGLLMKATARANTDYCDVFPQRLYVAALNVTEPGTTFTVRAPGSQAWGSAMLRNLAPPLGNQAAFHYVRIPTDRDTDVPPAPPSVP